MFIFSVFFLITFNPYEPCREMSNEMRMDFYSKYFYSVFLLCKEISFLDISTSFPFKL